MLDQDELARVRLPIGEMTKAEVRERAAGARAADCRQAGQPGHLLRRSRRLPRLPARALPGGRAARRRSSTPTATWSATTRGPSSSRSGQRKGLGVAFGEPRYVVDLQPASATVVIGTRADTEVKGCRLEEVSFVAGEPPGNTELTVKVRYRAAAVTATLEHDGAGYMVRFHDPQEAVAPGQAAVMYADDEVVGGGTIAEVVR